MAATETGATNGGIYQHHHHNNLDTEGEYALRELEYFHEATGDADFMTFTQCEKHRTIAAWLSDGSVSPGQLRTCWDKWLTTTEQAGEGMDIEVRVCVRLCVQTNQCLNIESAYLLRCSWTCSTSWRR